MLFVRMKMFCQQSVFVLVVLFVVFEVKAQGEPNAEWSYRRQNAWPASCRGNLQSPIDIRPEETLNAFSSELVFGPEYYQRENATITNSGHTIEVRLSNTTNLPTLRGGGLKDKYVLDSFHFHWGAEHTMNGYRYPLEAHFVHYAKKYGTLENALNFRKGVAVLGVWYFLSRIDNPAFDDLIVDIPKVAHNTRRQVILQNGVIVSDFFPPNTKNFYRYDGSLTTPNCNEVVVWTLFSEPSYISKRQLQRLSQIWDNENMLLDRNYRDLQKLNGRSVYFVMT